MFEKSKEFWKNKKDIIKNTLLLVLIPVTVISLIAVHSMEKIIKDNELDEEFYGNDKNSGEEEV